MSFSNEFLCDFKPVYEGILAAKGIKPERAVVEVIDEEQEGAGMFEPAGLGWLHTSFYCVSHSISASSVDVSISA